MWGIKFIGKEVEEEVDSNVQQGSLQLRSNRLECKS
jgi:hypothetical protein